MPYYRGHQHHGFDELGSGSSESSSSYSADELGSSENCSSHSANELDRCSAESDQGSIGFDALSVSSSSTEASPDTNVSHEEAFDELVKILSKIGWLQVMRRQVTEQFALQVQWMSRM